MKKKGLIAIIGCLIVVGVLVAAFSGRKPYRGLEASDIVSATVHLIPPDKTIQVTDIEKLVAHLNEIVIYNEDNSYEGLVGQSVVLTLTIADGSQEIIEPINPIFVINGIGYKTKYEPCERLSGFVNGLLDQAA